jgi:hypothetical protein
LLARYSSGYYLARNGCWTRCGGSHGGTCSDGGSAGLTLGDPGVTVGSAVVGALEGLPVIGTSVGLTLGNPGVTVGLAGVEHLL